MSNVRTNPIFGYIRKSTQILTTVLLITGCGKVDSQNSETDTESRKSEQLLREIEKAKISGDYNRVVSLCDSIDKVCSDSKEAREKALEYWSEAQLLLLQDTASQLDERLKEINDEMALLMPEFVKKDIKGIDSYRIIKSVDSGSIVDKTAIQPRLGDEDDLWTLIVNVNGAKPEITGMRLITDNNVITEVTSQNPESRRATETDGEMYSFNAEEAEPIARTLSDGGYDKARLDIIGNKRIVSIPLNSTMIDAIIKTWKMARLREDRQTILKKRELTERKIVVMKKQP